MLDFWINITLDPDIEMSGGSTETDNELYQMSFEMKNRKRFSLKHPSLFKEWVHKLVRWLTKRCRERNPDEQEPERINTKLYNKGQEKYLNELDVSTLLMTIRKVEWIYDTLISKNHSYLQKFSQ